MQRFILHLLLCYKISSKGPTKARVNVELAAAEVANQEAFPRIRICAESAVARADVGGTVSLYR